VECAARDEEDVVGADDAVLGGDGGALDQRQQVALHALARNIGPLRLLAAGDLVDFVQEHDAVLLRIGQRLGLEVIVIDHARRLLVSEQPHCLRYGNAPGPLLAAANVLEHALDLLREFLHAGRAEDLHLARRGADLDVEFLVVERPFPQHFAEFLPCRIVGRLHVLEIDSGRNRQQQVEHLVLRLVRRAIADLLHFQLAHLLDRDVG
jgi:hypothetical protein